MNLLEDDSTGHEKGVPKTKPQEPHHVEHDSAFKLPIPWATIYDWPDLEDECLQAGAPDREADSFTIKDNNWQLYTFTDFEKRFPLNSPADSFPMEIILGWQIAETKASAKKSKSSKKKSSSAQKMSPKHAKDARRAKRRQA